MNFRELLNLEYKDPKNSIKQIEKERQSRRNFLKGFLATATVVALAPLPPVVELSTQSAIYRAPFEEIVRITLQKYRPVFADLLLENQRKPSYFYRIIRHSD